ncbi:MAG: gliding motility-associated ABC transporter substrate-binding protein GldG [Bacteroidales bacterium]|jgi:ABC-2 type transport system permease protein|nr:gliding motility-associated ABC transporter substrate-binding protein GldG [Bacteroidales bacterium]
MKHLYFKEISMFFSSVMGYLVITVFLLLTGLFLFVFPSGYNIFDYGYATLDAFFSMAPMVFLFLIPAITMRSFSEERRTGTIEILMTKPLSDFQIVAAKYWACVTLLVLALIPTATYVYAIQQLSQIRGNVDMGGIWGSYFGLLFIGGAFTAIGIFLSVISKNQIVAFILSVIVCGFMLFGFNLIGGFFGRYETFVQDLGMSVHYTSMSRGVIDIRDVVYFLGIIALFVTLTLNRLQAQKKSFVKRSIFFGQILFWVIVLNFAVSFVFLRLDLTSEKRYTLHRNTKHLVKNLDKVVYFKIYLDGDLPPGFKRLRTATKEMLEEFRAYNDKVQFEFVNLYDIKDEKERGRTSFELAQKGIQPTNVEVREKGGVSRKLIFPAAEVTYQGEMEVMELLQSQVGLSSEEALNNSIQTLEYQLMSTIYKLTQKDKKSVAFIEGHGEAGVYETVEAMFALDGFYDVERVRMNQNPATLLAFSEDTDEILPAYDAIIIVQPKQRVPDVDKWAIDQYIMHGGKVLWALDASNASLDSLRGADEQFAMEFPHNLNDMLFRYGVRVNSNLIMDLNSSSIPLITGYIGDQPQTDFFRYPFLPILVSQNRHSIVRNLNPIRSEFISSIDTLENDIHKSILLTTSPYTRTVSLPAIINFDLLKQNPNPNDFRRGELPVAVLLEGSFESHFPRRMAYGLERITIPMKHQSNPTQMIVISDASIIMNRFNFEQGFPFPMGFDPYTKQIYANKTFFVNCVNYLLDGSLLLDLRAKTIKLRLLDKQRIEKEKTKWLLLTLGLPTGLVILCAVGFTGFRRWRYTRN